MQIVFLDSKSILSEDIDTTSLKQLGVLSLYPRTESGLIKQRLRGANIVLTFHTPINAEAILSANTLQMICILGNDISLVDIKCAAQKGITVCTIPDYASDDIVQHTLALLLELCSHIGYHDRKIHAGAWCSSPDFCWWELPSVSLKGKTAGIIGCGTVGKRMAKLYTAMGLRVLGFDVRPQEGFNGEYVPIEKIFTDSDVISLHCPLTQDTAELIDRNALKKMKNTAFLLNTSSGALVKESDVCLALSEGSIAGYAADSVSTEPISVHNPLLKAPRCILSAHSSCSSQEARQTLIKMAAETVSSYLEGNPINSVY